MTNPLSSPPPGQLLLTRIGGAGSTSPAVGNLTGSVHAPAQLREILTTMSARLVEAAFVALPLRGRPLDAAGIAADPELSAALASGLARFAAAIAAEPRADR